MISVKFDSLSILCLSIGLLVFVSATQATERPPDEGPLRVCVRPNAGLLTLSDRGEPEGLEFDLLRGFAETLGTTLEVDWQASFADLLPAVKRGDCPLGSAAITVTPERAQEIDFSTPYFPVRIVRVELGPTRFEASPPPTVQRLAVVGGTVHEELARGFEKARVVVVERDEALFEALHQGEVDAVVCDSAILLPYLSRFPELRVTRFLSERSNFAFALPPDSSLKAPLDRYLDQLVASGEYRRLLVRHFGEEGAAVLLEEDD